MDLVALVCCYLMTLCLLLMLLLLINCGPSHLVCSRDATSQMISSSRFTWELGTGLCTRGEPVTRDPWFWPFRGCRVDTRDPTRDTERRVSTQPAPVKKMLCRVGWRVFKLPLFLRYGYQSISIMMNEYWNWYVFWLYRTIWLYLWTIKRPILKILVKG